MSKAAVSDALGGQRAEHKLIKVLAAVHEALSNARYH